LPGQYAWPTCVLAPMVGFGLVAAVGVVPLLFPRRALVLLPVCLLLIGGLLGLLSFLGVCARSNEPLQECSVSILDLTPSTSLPAIRARDEVLCGTHSAAVVPQAEGAQRHETAGSSRARD